MTKDDLQEARVFAQGTEVAVAILPYLLPLLPALDETLPIVRMGRLLGILADEIDFLQSQLGPPPRTDREVFVKQNAVAVVADLERKVERQRLELKKLNHRRHAHVAERRTLVERIDFLQRFSDSLQRQLEANFIEHLEKASATVREWPAWKRNVLGRLPETEPASDGPPLRKGDVVALRFPGPPKVLEHDDVAEEYAIVRCPDAAFGLVVYAKFHGEWRANTGAERAVALVLLEKLALNNRYGAERELALQAKCDQLQQQVDRLLRVIRDVHAQHADDLCWMPADVNQIFQAAGLPPQDLRVGDTEAMLANCRRYVACLQAGGPWQSYAALEQERDALKELVRHCWAHSGHQNCGYGKMTAGQQALYVRVIHELGF